MNATQIIIEKTISGSIRISLMRGQVGYRISGPKYNDEETDVVLKTTTLTDRNKKDIISFLQRED